MKPAQLIMTLGVLYGLGSSFIFAPAVVLIDGWFVEKRTLANGILYVSKKSNSIFKSNANQLRRKQRCTSLSLTSILAHANSLLSQDYTSRMGSILRISVSTHTALPPTAASCPGAPRPRRISHSR